MRSNRTTLMTLRRWQLLILVTGAMTGCSCSGQNKPFTLSVGAQFRETTDLQQACPPGTLEVGVVTASANYTGAAILMTDSAIVTHADAPLVIQQVSRTPYGSGNTVNSGVRYEFSVSVTSWNFVEASFTIHVGASVAPSVERERAAAQSRDYTYTVTGCRAGPPPPPPADDLIVFSSDLAKQDEQFDIFTMNRDGTNITPLTITPGVDETDPKWSPDRTQIAYLAPGDHEESRELWVMDADGSNPRQLTDLENFPGEPYNVQGHSWSPDGTEILISADDDLGGRLLIVDVAMAETTGLQSIGSSDTDPVWAPDGTIYFIREYDLWKFPPGSLFAERLAETPEIEVAPTVNSTGDQLVYIRDGEVYLINPLVPFNPQLVYTGDYAARPSISPDDLWILFVATGPFPAPKRLSIVPAAPGGGMLEEIPNQVGDFDDPDW